MNMLRKSLIAVAGFAAVLSVSVPANSQPAPGGAALASEAEMVGLRQLCDHGDRQACIRFGYMLGASRERQVEWRRLHPDWWAWEHR
jgi:hypothetical protein